MAGLFYLFHNEKFHQLYNCSNFDIDEVPLEQRRRPYLGTLNIIFFLLFQIPYIPCMFAIWRHLDMSCYKIIFLIGLVDIPALWIIGLLSGVLSIRGDVYCSCSQLNYIAGMILIFCWSTETCCACLLAVNRCLDFALPSVTKFLFEGRRTWFFFVPIVSYSVYYGFFTIPCLWSPIVYYWDFNPYNGYAYGEQVAGQYVNMVDQIHTPTITLTIPIIYILFFVLLKLEFYGIQHSSGPMIRVIFIQTLLVCLANCADGIGYTLVGYLDIGPVLTIFCCTYMWMLIHGLPALVYLGLNKTIRNDCKQILFGIWKSKPKENAKVGVTRTIMVTEAPNKAHNHHIFQRI